LIRGRGPRLRPVSPVRIPAAKKGATLRVRLNLNPGQQATEHLLRQYKDRPVCVRYPYDEKNKKQYTTVELIVEQEPWQPDTIVRIASGYDEADLQQKVKDAGGRKNRLSGRKLVLKCSKSTKTWKIPFKTVRKPGFIGKEIQPQ
jgi:hypothetical protein